MKHTRRPPWAARAFSGAHIDALNAAKKAMEEQEAEIERLRNNNAMYNKEIERLHIMLHDEVVAERERCALVIAGWSTADNYLPDIHKRTSGWLAERDLKMAKAIRERGND